MKDLKIYSAVLIWAVTFCALTTNSSAYNKDLVGMWTASGACEFVSIEFREDGTFNADNGLDNMYSNISGTYEVNGKTISLTVTSNPNVPAQAHIIELTKFKISNSNLSFRLNGNKCKYTRAVFR